MIAGNFSSFVKYFLVTTLVMGLFVTSYADDPEEAPKFRFSDEALLGFFDSNQEISALQREIQERINATVEKNGLTPERFRQIGSAAQIGALDTGTFSPEEIAAFNTTAPEVTAIQREQQSMMQALLAEKGLTTQQYQEIIQEFRQNQDLQAYVRELARERALEAAREERRRQREAEAQEGGNSQN